MFHLSSVVSADETSAQVSAASAGVVGGGVVAALIAIVVIMAIIISILVIMNKRKKTKAGNEPGIYSTSTVPANWSLCFFSAFEYTNMPPPINVGDNPMYMGADKVGAGSGPPSSQNTLSRQFMNPLYDYDEDEGITSATRD